MSKFKVGDKVQTVYHWKDQYHYGIIANIPDDEFLGHYVLVDWYAKDGKVIKGIGQFDNSLELVEPKMQQVPYSITDGMISVFLDGKSHFVNRGDQAFEELREHLKGPHDPEVIRELVDKKAYVAKVSEGMVTVDKEQVLYKNQPIHNALSKKLLGLLSEGFDIRPWARFMDNLLKNPSYRSREQLHGFLEKWSTPITEDGCFLAFKYLREDFKDAYTGTMDNSPGKIVEMPREEVDDDPNRTCSAGLHACASHYLQGYATNRKIVVVKINPMDVVSIPTDYDFSKMRVCRYEVLREVDHADIPRVESQEMVSDWRFLDDYSEDVEDDYYYDSYEDSYSY